MNVSGKLIEIGEVVQVKETFKKRDFVIEFSKNPKYPEVIQFQVAQDKCALLDGLMVGDEVDIDFDLRGRKWTDSKGAVKYFNTLQAWKVARVGEPSQSSYADSKNVGERHAAMNAPATDDGDSGLPF